MTDRHCSVSIITRQNLYNSTEVFNYSRNVLTSLAYFHFAFNCTPIYILLLLSNFSMLSSSHIIISTYATTHWFNHAPSHRQPRWVFPHMASRYCLKPHQCTTCLYRLKTIILLFTILRMLVDFLMIFYLITWLLIYKFGISKYGKPHIL